MSIHYADLMPTLIRARLKHSDVVVVCSSTCILLLHVTTYYLFWHRVKRSNIHLSISLGICFQVLLYAVLHFISFFCLIFVIKKGLARIILSEISAYLFCLGWNTLNLFQLSTIAFSLSDQLYHVIMTCLKYWYDFLMKVTMRIKSRFVICFAFI